MTRHYCHDASCAGVDGFDIRWLPATMVDPSEPERDSCPYCGHEMHDEPLPYEDASAAFADALGITYPAGEAGRAFERRVAALAQQAAREAAA